VSIDPYEWDVCSLAKHAEALAAERDAIQAEAAKWERLFDAVHYALCDQITDGEETHEAAARIAAEVREWRKLRDPVTLHANLVRGVPCRLPQNLLLHLLGDDMQDAVAERDKLRELIRAYVRDDSGDTWGALLRAVGYDCE
jgi:hypothetical protein